jgi:hypothetical protein
MNWKGLMNNDFKGSTHGLTKVLPWNLPGKNKENDKNTQTG